MTKNFIKTIFEKDFWIAFGSCFSIDGNYFESNIKLPKIKTDEEA